MEFKISSRAKKVTFTLMIVGLLATLWGVFTEQSYIHTALSEDGTQLTFTYPNHNNGKNTPAEWQQFKDDLKAAAEKQHIEITEAGEHGHGDHSHDGHDTEHEGGQPIHEDGEHHDHGDDHGHGHHADYTWTVGAHIMHTVEGHNAWHHHEDQVMETVQCMVDGHKVGMPDHQHNRFWSNLLINGFFFFGISLGALFYLALHYATESGWGAVILRIFEGVMLVLPFGAIVLLVVFIGATFDMNHIYMWMDDSLLDPTKESFDKLIYAKSGYLNDGFFWIRTLVYIAVFMIFAYFFRRWSKKEDIEGGTRLHFLQYRRGALFLVFFAVFSSTLAWDWIMSIDAHWFSTLFGWYVFSGIWISAMIMILITALYLKSRGYLSQINQSHIHDLAKWIFAISFLWSYLWFSQFMLIWYSNIGEEVVYFQQRIMDYKFLFFGTFAINFILPMVLMMSRDAKRTWSLLMIIGGIIFVGHWMDVYLMVMPGTIMNNYQIGFLEVGMFIMFLGIFVFMLLKNLTKAPLIKKNHPMLDESVHHDF